MKRTMMRAGLAATLLLAGAGCGDDRGAEPVPVEGRYELVSVSGIRPPATMYPGSGLGHMLTAGSLELRPSDSTAIVRLDVKRDGPQGPIEQVYTLTADYSLKDGAFTFGDEAGTGKVFGNGRDVTLELRFTAGDYNQLRQLHFRK